MTEKEAKVQGVSIEQLANISLDAAIALDRIVRGKRVDDPSPISGFLRIISDSTKELDEVARERRLVNPFMIEMCKRVIVDYSANRPKTIRDVQIEVARMVGLWSPNKANRPSADLSMVRDFAIAFAQHILAECASAEYEPPFTRHDHVASIVIPDPYNREAEYGSPRD